MILVHALGNLAIPDESAAELIEVAALRQYHVACSQGEATNVGFADRDHLHLI